jgi:alpha-glucoside transport system permease protein
LSLVERLPGNEYAFVGLENYTRMFAEPKFMEALRNNMLWLIVVPALSTGFGLLAAQLTDRIWWGNIAKSIIFMPMAISLVGASVIFKLIYETRPEDTAQIGVLNALWLRFDGGIFSFLLLKALPFLIIAAMIGLLLYAIYQLFLRVKADGGLFFRGFLAVLGLILAWLIIPLAQTAIGVLTVTPGYGEPQTWLTINFYNNFFLMIVLVWIQTGFAMVILSAALRGIPEETVEAAIVDGANPFQVFFKIKVPQIMGTIVVVWTTITIVVLKVFDIVFAMTNGQWETQVLANYMYDKLFRANDWGMGSASAIIILIMVTPILVWNVYNARKEMR